MPVPYKTHAVGNWQRLFPNLAAHSPYSPHSPFFTAA